MNKLYDIVTMVPGLTSQMSVFLYSSFDIYFGIKLDNIYENELQSV